MNDDTEKVAWMERVIDAARSKIARLEHEIGWRPLVVDGVEQMVPPAPQPQDGERFCCYIECGAVAEYELHYGYGPEDFTDACTRHVGEMLTGAPCNRVYALNFDFGARPHLMVIDDPQGPTAGGTLEAHVQNEETGEWSRAPEKDIPVAGQQVDPLAQHEWARDFEGTIEAVDPRAKLLAVHATGGPPPSMGVLHGHFVRHWCRLAVERIRGKGEWVLLGSPYLGSQPRFGTVDVDGKFIVTAREHRQCTVAAPYWSLGDNREVLVWVEKIPTAGPDDDRPVCMKPEHTRQVDGVGCPDCDTMPDPVGTANKAIAEFVETFKGKEDEFRPVVIGDQEPPAAVTYDLSTGDEQFHFHIAAFPPGMVTRDGHLMLPEGTGVFTEEAMKELISEGGVWLAHGSRDEPIDHLLGGKLDCYCEPECGADVEHRVVAWRTRGDGTEVLVKPMGEGAAEMPAPASEGAPRMAHCRDCISKEQLGADIPPWCIDCVREVELMRLRAFYSKVESGGGGCVLAGPGRGDCENSVGLPGQSVPGQHDGDDDTVDACGKPNGWCWPCWKSRQIAQLQSEIEKLRREAAGVTP
jgi:hypothetical protein